VAQLLVSIALPLQELLTNNGSISALFLLPASAFCARNQLEDSAPHPLADRASLNVIIALCQHVQAVVIVMVLSENCECRTVSCGKKTRG